MFKPAKNIKKKYEEEYACKAFIINCLKQSDSDPDKNRDDLPDKNRDALSNY